MTAIEVTVESLGGLGDGIARFGDKPVFIPKSCPGDRLEVRIVHKNHDGLHGAITKIISPGAQRQTAPCRHFDRCGGCTLQHLLPESYQEFKTRMLHQALARAGFPAPQAGVVFLPPHTRRRVEFKVKHDGDKIALAFHDLRSHDATPVEECLILKPELQAMIEPLNAALSGKDFSPHLYAVSLTSADSGIDMMLTLKGCATDSLPPLLPLAQQLGLLRISARTPGSKPAVIAQLAPVEITLGQHKIALPADAFLQATNEGQAHLTRVSLEAIAPGETVVDLFCGIGSYSFPASAFTHVHAVEGDPDMVQTTTESIARHSIKTLSAEQRDLFKNPLTVKELSRFSAAIINPPRVGAKAQTQALAQSTVKTIVMVSCNPATFARDAKILGNAGFDMLSAEGLDQFLWSQHLEIIAIFRRTL